MDGISLTLNREKLILDAVTQMLSRSFNNLPETRKKQFVRCFDNKKPEYRYKDLQIERKLWDIRESNDSRFDRVVLRCDINDRKLDDPRIFAKAGLTRQFNNSGYGLAVCYGWNNEFRSPKFEKNMVKEMNKATLGVKMYCSTPGEKGAIGRLKRPISLKNYID